MNIVLSPEERLLIDRYLDGSLSGLELQKFMERLDEDEAFRAKVSLQNLLTEGIVRCADSELHKDLIESLNYRKPRVPLEVKLILTFIVITLSGIILWDYIGTDSSGVRKHILSFSWFDRSQKSFSSESSSRENAADKTGKSGTEDRRVGVISKDGDMGTDFTPERKESIDTLNSTVHRSEAEQFIVKKDQLLITQSLMIQDATINSGKVEVKKGRKDSSLSSNAVEKLNPSAGLENKVEENVNSDQLLVEFWVSPINYRGYKLHRGKLILFGMEEPDSIQLFRQGDKLFMRHLNDYYLLDPSEDFTSYILINEKEFSLQSTK